MDTYKGWNIKETKFGWEASKSRAHGWDYIGEATTPEELREWIYQEEGED